jgi:ribosomal protein L11 methyltransferase
MVLDRFARKRQRFHNILDLGTGTGVLALAAHKRWPQAAVIGSDIDPVSTLVAAQNARINRVRTGRAPGLTEWVTAKGMNAQRLRERARYDLLIANILAAPLVGLAGDISAALAPGGYLVLAGLLNSQKQRVIAAYRAYGLCVIVQHKVGEWPTLVLHRPVTGAMREITELQPG